MDCKYKRISVCYRGGVAAYRRAALPTTSPKQLRAELFSTTWILLESYGDLVGRLDSADKPGYEAGGIVEGLAPADDDVHWCRVPSDVL